VRVIAGKAKGRRLKGPAADRSIRPTSDLVRGAIFSALASLGADLSRVLDLYAGSGALGIEALSRGAGTCEFVEQDRAACAIIRQNLEVTGFQGQGQVHCTSVERALAYLEGKYTLVLADPPYADPEALAILEKLAASELVSEGQTVLTLEHSSRQQPPERIGWWLLVNSRRHGDSAVSLYR